MKVCSLYGAGYYYMPGTDICLKLGGYVRYQHNWNPGTSITSGPMSGQGGRQTRIDETDQGMRTRALITVDTRQQTAYGTLRTYILIGYNQDSVVTAGAVSGGNTVSVVSGAPTTSPAVYMTRGFIQIAGFTFGKATSFFDIMPSASFAYNAGVIHSSDTGDGGMMVAAYTAQFGNGVSATIAAQQNARGPVFAVGTPTSAASFAVAALGNNSLGHLTNNSGMPDVVGNIRMDQAWGSVLAAFALHDASGGYYTVAPVGTSTTSTGVEGFGHPENKLGWAVTGGFIWNLPMIAPGDRLSAVVNYTEGAVKYASNTASTGNLYASFGGMNGGFGMFSDAVFGGQVGNSSQPATSIQLTTAWSIAAAFEHLWTPALRTSVYGSYVEVKYNSTANELLCQFATGVVKANRPDFVCDFNWSTWNIGTRTQWEPVKGLVMGLDVLYIKLNSMQYGAPNGLAALTPGGAKLASTVGNTATHYTVSDQSAWTAAFRIQRDFMP